VKVVHYYGDSAWVFVGVPLGFGAIGFLPAVEMTEKPIEMTEKPIEMTEKLIEMTEKPVEMSERDGLR
jgi:hypothetical protein